MSGTNDEAVIRYMTAKGYMEAAKMVHVSQHQDDTRRVMTLLPMCMLVGFALELYLKAWLLHDGMAPKDVRAKGHKLLALKQEAETRGFVFDARTVELIDTFAAGHEDFTYRYIESGDSVKGVNWDAALPVLDAFDTAIDAAVGASASYGFQPGH